MKTDIYLGNLAWANIAGYPLEDIKENLITGYRQGKSYGEDSFSELFEQDLVVNRILDFGCGIGRNFPSLARHSDELVGYDIPEMIKTCRKYTSSKVVRLIDDWSQVLANPYDLAVAAFVLQHIDSSATLNYYIGALAGITDYLFVRGRSWRDGPHRDNVLAKILNSGKFELIRCHPGHAEVVRTAPDQDLHFDALLRTTDTRLRRQKNEEIFGTDIPIVMQHRDFIIHFDRRPLRDRRGIGRVNRALLEELKKSSTILPSGYEANGYPRVYYFGSVHWSPRLLPSPSVILIHDVIPLLFPESFQDAARHWRENLTPIARQADLIITVSNSSANDIAAKLDIDPEKLRVIPNGVKALTEPEQCTVELPTPPYIVYIGSDDVHKNLSLLFELVSHPALENITLAMIGDLKKITHSGFGASVSDRVRFYGELDDSQAASLIKFSHALVMPSFYEGFGLPPFEAAMLGVPSICSNRPAMNELLEDAAILAEPDSVDAWADAIETLYDPHKRDSIVTAAKRKACQLTPQLSAQKILKILREVAQR